jgi:5-methyltetrahydrofolate--homocysteine methyltransferase
MVAWEKILDAAVEHKADIIGLSGLITPSLDEMVTVAKKAEERGLKTPILIGGATTSKMHTAVKIAPVYSGPVVYVLDASRSVPVAQALVDKNVQQRREFCDEIAEQYGELREEFFAGLEDRKYLALDAARGRALKVDFTSPEHAPFTPKKVGLTLFDDVPIDEVIPYIDWNPFFQVWQLRGRYPNRGYPKIFNDPTVGAEAKKLYDDAEAMLKDFAKGKKLKLRGVAGIWPANSVGDDVELYEDEDARREHRSVAKFYGLRQQAEREDDGGLEPHLCLSDFVAPRESGVADWIGGFACTAGHGIDALVEQYKAAQDDYSYIMAEALADRLAEALAERMHELVRKEVWGYAPDEDLTVDDLLKVKYQGIRPAPGYPSQPDSSEKTTLAAMLKMTENSGIELTESLAMMPAASVSGLYYAGKCSSYFAVGKITQEQVNEYALRKKMPVEEVERWLLTTLSYEP